jgi:hypothetical protein
VNRRLFASFAFIASVLILIVGTGIASAQTDVYKLNYFSNNDIVFVGGGIGIPLGLPFATVRIDNPGLTYGNICAMIYVFDADQQMTECCGCAQSHNNLSTIGVPDLTLNPLTGVISTNGVIKIVSGRFTGVCDPTSFTPQANLRAWGTHVQNAIAPTVFPVTETEFSDSTLGATELANLQNQCDFIEILGSGHGICTCAADMIAGTVALKH